MLQNNQENEKDQKKKLLIFKDDCVRTKPHKLSTDTCLQFQPLVGGGRRIMSLKQHSLA